MTLQNEVHPFSRQVAMRAPEGEGQGARGRRRDSREGSRGEGRDRERVTMWSREGTTEEKT